MRGAAVYTSPHPTTPWYKLLLPGQSHTGDARLSRASLREQELQPREGHNGRSLKGPSGQAEREAVGCPQDPVAPRGSCRLHGLCCWSLWFCPSLLSRLPAVSATSPPAPKGSVSRSAESRARWSSPPEGRGSGHGGTPEMPPDAQRLGTRGRESQPHAGCCCHLQAVLRTSSRERCQVPRRWLWPGWGS